MAENTAGEITHPKLTQRESEVLVLVAYGYSAKEIASRLKIAPRTVERHTENIRLKLRARNRAHTITLAILEGYLDIGPPPKQLECAECLFRPSGRSALNNQPIAPVLELSNFQ